MTVVMMSMDPILIVFLITVTSNLPDLVHLYHQATINSIRLVQFTAVIQPSIQIDIKLCILTYDCHSDHPCTTYNYSILSFYLLLDLDRCF